MPETTETAIPAKVKNGLARIENVKIAIRNELILAGAPVDAQTPLEQYPDRVRDLRRFAAVPEDIAALTVRLNAPDSGYALPTDSDAQQALLRGARITLAIDGIAYPVTTPVDDLTDALYTLRVPADRILTGTARLILGNASPRYAADPVPVTLRPGTTLDINMTTHTDDRVAVSIGRVSFRENVQDTAAGTSFPIRRDYSAGGTVTRFGGWLPSGQWFDLSGFRVSVYDVANADSTPVERIITSGGVGVTDRADDLLACIREARQVKVVYHADNPENDIVNYFMRIPRAYVKQEDVTIDIPTYTESGAIDYTTPTDVHIEWMSDTPIDDGFHLHAAFVQYRYNPETDTHSEVELPAALFARYPINYANLVAGGKTLRVATSRPDGSSQVGGRRDEFLGASAAINEAPVTIDGVPFAANTDPRRFSMMSTSDWGFIALLAYILYGHDIQAVLGGVFTGSGAATKNGATDYILNKGILFGGPDTDSNAQPIIFLGIEDAFWSSTGQMIPDQTQFCERLEDDTADYYTMAALDRLVYAPVNSSNAIPGYRRLQFQTTAANTVIGQDYRPGFRDWLIGTPSTETDVRFGTGAVDTSWCGSAPAAGTTGINAYMVALCGYRSNGSALGLWSRVANHALSSSNGSYWRARTSIQLPSESNDE